MTPMPSRFEPLARYNAEVSRGIAHSPEWDESMAADLQRDYDKWIGGQFTPRDPWWIRLLARIGKGRP